MLEKQKTNKNSSSFMPGGGNKKPLPFSLINRHSICIENLQGEIKDFNQEQKESPSYESNERMQPND